MSKKTKQIENIISSKKEIIEADYTSDDGSSSGSSQSEEVIIVPKKIKLEKSTRKQKEPKERKPYVITEARKKQFEQAKAKRDENIRINKELREKEQEHIKQL